MKKSKKNILIGALSFVSVGTILTLGITTSIKSANSDENNLQNLPISNLENDSEEKLITKAPFAGKILDKNAVDTLGWATKREISLKDWEQAPNVITIGSGGQSTSPFFNNKSLKSIQIPKRITSIHDNSFLSSSVSTVTFEANSSLARIGLSAFQFSLLTSINIPSSVTTIDDSAFSSAGAIQTFTFEPNSKLTSIGQSAFQKAGIRSIDIPDSVLEIGNNAFSETWRWLNGKQIKLPVRFRRSNPSFGFTAAQWNEIQWKIAQFQGTVLTKQDAIGLDWHNKNIISLNDWTRDAPNVVQIGTDNETSGEGVFSNASKLQSIQIPDKVTSIGNFAFENTKSLASIVMTNSSAVKSIGASAFLNSGILQINIPDPVTTIGEGAFAGTVSLNGNHVSIKAELKAGSVKALYGFSQEQWDTIAWRITPFNETVLTRAGVISLGWDTEETISLVDWRRYAPRVTQIGTGTETSGQGLFSNNKVLKTIEIPEQITSIGNYVFENSSITSINVPSGVRTIGTHTFTGTQSLVGNQVSMELRLKNSSSVPLYGFDANQWNSIIWRVRQFSGDTLTKEIVISLGWDTEKTITLDKWKRLAPNVTKIGTNVKAADAPFLDNTTLELIEIPESVNFISDNAFGGTTSLTTIQFSYRSRTFNAENSSLPLFGLSEVQWNSIEWIQIPEANVIINSIIAKHLLKEDSIITWKEISGYTGIQTGAFKGTNITSITINYKANFTIQNNAFTGTDELTNIEFSENFKDSIANYGFSPNQINIIKFIKLPESNVGVIAGSISGAVLAVVAAVGAFYLFKHLKAKKQKLIYETGISSDDVYQEDIYYDENIEHNDYEEPEYEDHYEEQSEYDDEYTDYEEPEYEEEYLEEQHDYVENYEESTEYDDEYTDYEEPEYEEEYLEEQHDYVEDYEEPEYEDHYEEQSEYDDEYTDYEEPEYENVNYEEDLEESDEYEGYEDYQDDEEYDDEDDF